MPTKPPGQHGRQERQADELARRVEADGGGAFLFREPGGDDAAGDRVGGRFQRADRQAQHEQDDEAAGEPHEEGGGRPQD
ncbi:hypothetical protein G6F64_015557 [Rhizopus arrhizus]|uniref:Uncharacterized protein n=1 Tax=Rhizopus oryzae TaxID=64495 RepID=A0A9P7BII0_RHIOR|nr:hypothetical protein G6F64_015557 [Rhizopus arrhizus]